MEAFWILYYFNMPVLSGLDPIAPFKSIGAWVAPILQSAANSPASQSLQESWSALLSGTEIDWIGIGKIIIQLAILSSILYVVYSRIIHRNHAEQILKGLFVILLLFIALWGASRVMGFTMLEVVFGASIQLLIIGLIVIFQPELRRLLLYLGQADWFTAQGGVLTSEEKKAEYLIQEITEAVRYMSKTRTGALIVMEPSNVTSGSYLEAGTKLDARLSTELLLTIFHTNAPLHDGAVIINEDNRIVSAGVLLPLTEDPNLSWRYGTRHRAAIGLSETSDSRCIVVSEETGAISFVEGGILEKLSGPDDLKKKLERIYHVSSRSSNKNRKKLLMGERLTDLFTQVEARESLFRRMFSMWGKPAAPAGEDTDTRTSASSRN